MIILTFEQTALCLLIRWIFSWSWGLPHAFIQRLHFSKSLFGFGNGINLYPCILLGYRSSEFIYKTTFPQIHSSVCLWDKDGGLFTSPDLIKNAARWLVGYFSLIDVSEAWITKTRLGHPKFSMVNNDEFQYVCWCQRNKWSSFFIESYLNTCNIITGLYNATKTLAFASYNGKFE